MFVCCSRNAHYGACGIYSDSYCAMKIMQSLGFFLFASQSRNQNIVLSLVQPAAASLADKDTRGMEQGCTVSRFTRPIDDERTHPTFHLNVVAQV